MPRRSIPDRQKRLGYCIYCGSTNDLRREHIYPFSLGGNKVLHAASCLKCADVTKQIEQTVTRSMLGNHRVQWGYPTRHKKDRPAELTIEIHTSGKIIEHRILVDDCPAVPIMLPIFGLPTLITGAEPSPTFQFRECIWQIDEDDPGQKIRLDALRAKFGANASIIAKVDFNALTRLLAKIAHAGAIYAYRGAIKRPLLPDYILGKNQSLPSVVGSWLGERPAHASNSPWRAEFGTFTLDRNGVCYLTATIEVLRDVYALDSARRPSPLLPYFVIVAEADEELANLVVSRAAQIIK